MTAQEMVRKQFTDLLGEFDEVSTYAQRTANAADDVTRSDLDYLAGMCAKLHGEMLILRSRLEDLS